MELKLGRAKEHLDALEQHIRSYVESRPYHEVHEYDPQVHSRAVGLRIVEPPRLGWSLLVGDFLYNLRSALDHLAWQLVLANGERPTNRTEFPIFKDAARYEDAVARKSAGMDPMAITFIESLQPYRRGSQALDHPLWLLHDLNITDKHRTLILTSAWVQDAVEFHVRLPGHADELAQVFFFEATRRPLEDKADKYAQQVLQVTLTEPQHLRHRPIVRLLKEQLEYVRTEVLLGLKPFLD